MHYTHIKQSPHSIRRKKICRKDNDIFSKKWENFDTVSIGETIIDSPTGNIVAPTDGYIIMPNENARVGDEWAYFGKLD